jgi:hypothetical protein
MGGGSVHGSAGGGAAAGGGGFAGLGTSQKNRKSIALLILQKGIERQLAS